MKISRYSDLESFLFQQLPMYQRVGPKAFKKNLDNIIKLSDYLGNPHESFDSIHVAGTNGKGSTSFYLASALHEMGYKVGLYTSPHYKDYRERIKINGKMIPKKYVKKFVQQLIDDDVFRSEFKPSFFEITVGMAFQYFADEKVDVAVIETGLGGRLDSTNIVTPLLSVITNIGLDHTNFLGNTLPLIAGEKAGIIKKGVPVVIGRKQKETKSVFEKVAKKNKAPLTYAENKRVKIGEFVPHNTADYQIENYRTAYVSLKLLYPKLKLDTFKTAWRKGIKKWGYMGRYQLLSNKPRIIADSAHNAMGIGNLFRQLASEKYKQLHIVLAVVSDKDLAGVLPLFPQSATYYYSQAKIPRAMDREVLAAQAEENGLQGKSYTTIGRALSAAKRRSSKGDMILVTGSIFTVAEVV